MCTITIILKLVVSIRLKKNCIRFSPLISINCFAQDKIVKIPQSELDAFFLAIDTLEYQDSIKTVLIADLQLQNTNFL